MFGKPITDIYYARLELLDSPFKLVLHNTIEAFEGLGKGYVWYIAYQENVRIPVGHMESLHSDLLF